MGAYTPNRNYYMPATGTEKGWGDKVNIEATTKIDTDVQNLIDTTNSMNTDLQDAKATILSINRIVTSEVLTDSGDHLTFTSAFPFIAGKKSVYIGNARTFDYTETLDNTITLNIALEEPDIKIRMDYIRSDI